MRPPVAVGGVGGSGTRVVAAALQALGYHIGDDLNISADNLAFTLLFVHRGVYDLSQTDFERLTRLYVKATHTQAAFEPAEVALVDDALAAHTAAGDGWLATSAAAMMRTDRAVVPPGAAWGWKQPNTHVVLDRLRVAFPGLRYVHVVRNGLDMAYSTNQAQLLRWGPQLLRVEAVEPTPRWSLRYWVAVQRRVFALGATMGDDFLALSYDDLCANPTREIARLCAFLRATPAPELRDRIVASVQPPPSIGRYRPHSKDAFDRADVDYVASLGFSVD